MGGEVSERERGRSVDERLDGLQRVLQERPDGGGRGPVSERGQCCGTSRAGAGRCRAEECEWRRGPPMGAGRCPA
jgi:hypothetical protein